MAEVEGEEQSLGLGDIIEIIGGRLNKTRGKIYEISDKRLSILPVGATDRTIKIDFIDGAPDPDLGIEEISLLKVSPLEGFINVVDLRAGQTVETFVEGADGTSAGPIFKVVSVNEEEDSALFEDDSGVQTEINFDFTGIPRDLGYEVMRTRESPANEGSVPPSTTEDAEEDDEAEDDEAEDDDLEADAPQGLEEEDDEFIVEETVLLKKKQEEVKEISTQFRIYQDVFQRSEMLGELIRILPQKQQRDPVKLQEVRRIVELMIILRNEVVKYGTTGEPRGLKPTSINYLAELVNRPDVTLARKIALIDKAVYLTHSDKHRLSKEKGLQTGLDDPPGPMEEGLYREYLEDILSQAEVIEKTAALEGDAEADATIGMPRFFLNMETYREKIQTPFIIKQGDTPLTTDEEVFRLEIPDTENPSVNSLQKDSQQVITQIPFSQTRILKPRISRFTTGEEFRIVEKGENPIYRNILVFPKSALRAVGPIRSGSLARDASLGMMPQETMEELLKRLGEISDFPTADGILVLGIDGNILGNVLVKDWLENLNITISGLGDTLFELRGYGIPNVEWNLEQNAVIQAKIEETLASLKIFMSSQREENKSLLSNLKFEPNPLLTDELSERILDRIKSEPILQKVLEEIEEYSGDLSRIDLNWFSILLITYPDLLIATLGQQPNILAKERLMNVREKYNTSLRTGYRLKKLIANYGEIPIENACAHVQELEKVRRLGQKYAEEPRDKTKIKGLLKLLNKFRGHIEDNWVFCNVCNKHLICGHELLQIQELLRPNEKDALQKEITLKFSGGQFSGKFACKVCGQGIQDLDFDTNIEFDDSGRPMMGRSVLVDEDAIKEEKLIEMLSGTGEEEEEQEYSSDQLNTMYNVFKKIAALVGINPEKEDLKKMVEELNNYISEIPTREIYATASKGKKVQDYDIWFSIRYVTAAAAIMLINIQTRVPDYIIYYTSGDCREGFFGYPLESEDKTAGLKCMATVISGINDNEFPWNLTTLQKEANLLKRVAAILPFVKNQVDSFVRLPVVQNALKRKRDYRTTLYGNYEGVKRDQIPQIFRPVPYIISQEEAAAQPVIAEAATAQKQATAWIRMAHSVAKSNAALNQDSPYSETTSCVHQLATPSTCWDELPVLEGRSLNTRHSTTVSSTFYTEKPKTLDGKLEAKDYYKLFAQLCYEGPAKGRPHELGIGLTCSQCDISFQEDPSINYVPDAKVMNDNDAAAADMKLKASIEAQGIIINEDTFNDLLRSARLTQSVLDGAPLYFPRQGDTFRWLNKYPAAIEGWEAILFKIDTNLADLGAAQLTKTQIAQAAEELIAIISVKEEFIKVRIGEKIYGFLASMIEKHPRECGEAINTYLLVPYQRWLSGMSQKNFKILDSYELSKGTMDDILIKGMGQHLQPISDEELNGIALLKVRLLVSDLSNICRYIFPYLRSMLVAGGKEMVTYFMRAYLFSAIHRFIDPQQIPQSDLDIEGTNANIKLLYKSLTQALTRYAVGSKVPTEEEIRTRLEQRAEQEKQVFIGKLDRLSREERKVENMLKSLGMGDWAAGGSKAIRQYDADRYEVERAERAAAGIDDYSTGNDPIDMFGTEMNYNDEGGGGGYDHDQIEEDDY